MASSSAHMTSLPLLFLISVTCLASMVQSSQTRPMNNTVSAIYVFGDSTVDPGNNNYIKALFKANWYPYGKDFINHTATGRFTNGKLATDFIASYVGIKEVIPAYLDPNITLEDMMSGVAFASAASGYDPVTASMSNAIHVPKQLDYFKDMKTKLEQSIGEERTQEHIKKSVFIISAGTNDFVLNYFNGVPLRRYSISVSDYQNLVLDQAKGLYQGLWDEGARKIVVAGLPPMGCVPAVITIHSSKTQGCYEDYNTVAQAFNDKLQDELSNMQNKLASDGAKIVYIDIFKPLDDIIKNYTKNGYDVPDSGCCGTGLIETSFMCNRAASLCTDASKYVFFDSIHPTEKAYHDVFESIIPVINYVITN
ncbi:GDSL lipase/esterase [Dillenia turbinata]|uniref:GDSL lipase/esterase n=1 Tax=Dillenia turbinata TaxID=194707 RepID=A0AAN8VSP2_9MAGN